MFYSHEILTSQKHGVATVWLVATLGQNSTSKKINRKTILNVDVPRACNTIMHPEAPMALRLQGNLLFGISKVYSRQCLYTLTDVQSMLDKMKIALRVVHGAGLHSDAGKARPEELIVPYDTAFNPDFTVPFIDLDLLNPLGSTAPALKLNESLISSNLSVSPHSQQLDLNTLPQLDFDSSSATLAEGGDFTFSNRSIQKERNNIFGGAELGAEEEGVLLQPDFDFDEEGNIIDIVMTDAPARQVETPVKNGLGREGPEDVMQGLEGDDIMATPAGDTFRDDLDNLDPRRRSPTWGRLPDPDYVEESPNNRNATSNRKLRAQKLLQMDVPTQIGREELLRWDREYLKNMTRSDLQKAYARDIAQARKNAVTWISDRGIGSVGMGVGLSGMSHPLQLFCGEALLIALSINPLVTKSGRKRRASDEEKGTDERNVRPKITDDEPEVGLTLGNYQEEVELGLDAPPPLPDDASAQMPWNITASLQGSVAGSSNYGGLGRHGSRFPSASPLAGRGLPRDLFGHDSLSSLSLKDFGVFNSDDLGGFIDERDIEEHAGRSKFESQATVSSLDDTDKNFLDFLKTGAHSAKPSQGSMSSPRSAKIAFSKLLPPESTSRTVATQALMHVLILATKDVIRVSQVKRCHGAPNVIDDLDDIRLKISEAIVL